MSSSTDPLSVTIYDLLISLTNAGDLISPDVADHHQRVAYLAFRIAEQLCLPYEQKKDLMLAGLLHDIGAFSLDDRLALNDGEPPSVQDHAVVGARLLEGFAPLAGAADCIRHHHVPWNYGGGRTSAGRSVSPLSHILHLADRVAVLLDPRCNVIEQVEGIQKIIHGQKGSVFVPELVDAFMALSTREYIWLDVMYKPLLYILPDILQFETLDLSLEDIVSLTGIFANIVDFRNPFTATHSAGVASTAAVLAGLAGFSEKDCRLMTIAGNLHDLGKLAVSKNLLEKPGDLDTDDQAVIRSHTFYTYRLLQPIKAFETISKWAAFHHERLNGSGYPFHLGGDSIPQGSRIMAVADIFTAVTEDRPYRNGMSKERTIDVLRIMAEDGVISPDIVSILLDNYKAVDDARQKAQLASTTKYLYIMRSAVEECCAGTHVISANQALSLDNKKPVLLK